MAVSIKPIETLFRGNRFRSRIEARWAVFYTELGIRYEYEKEGFELGDAGRYLPDFWLPDYHFWIEIKGAPMTEVEEAKIRSFADSGQAIYVFTGDIPDLHPYHLSSSDAGEIFGKESWDNGRLWCQCQTCGSIGIEFEGRTDRLPCKICFSCDLVNRDPAAPVVIENGCYLHGFAGSQGCPRSGGNGDRGHNWASPKLLAAYTAARSARFEYGEHGRWPSTRA